MNEQFFDWCNVVVGHWYVQSVHKIGSRFGLTYQCISKCGIYYTIRATDLAGDRIGSCNGCRSLNARTFLASLSKDKESNTGEIPYRLSNAIVPECVMSKLRHRFEETNMIHMNTDSLHNRHTVKAWEDNARDILNDMLARTGLGLNYGWKVRVIDATGNVSNGTLVRLRSCNAGIRQFLVAISPKHGGFAFDVDIRIGRNDDFEDIKARVKAAIDTMNPTSVKPVNGKPVESVPTAPIAVVPPTVQPASSIDTSIERLEKMRSGLDTLLNIANFAKRTSATKEEIQQRLNILKEKAEPTLRAKQQADISYAQSVTDLETSEQKLDSLDKQMKQLQTERESVLSVYNAQRADHKQAHEVKQAALATAIPFEQEIELAELELQEALQNETKQVTALNLSGDLPSILAALEKLSN